MKRFGLIGYPVKGSLSPALFGAGYRGRYPYDLIEEPDLDKAYARFLDGYDGVNVTAPFKECAFRKADTIDPVCQRIGATNLLVKTPEGIRAYNSDYTGIRRSLLEAISGWRYGENEDEAAEYVRGTAGNRMSALIVGCGGAGKAAAVAAADLGMRTFLMNRTASRAEKIAESLPQYGFGVRPLDDFAMMFRQCDVTVYTLPDSIDGISALASAVGPEEPVPVAGDGGAIPGSKVVLEANYRTPSFGRDTLARVRESFPGLKYISGLRWLLHQAAGGYELFTGEIPDFLAMEKAMAREV